MLYHTRMKVQWAVPIIASILILGTLGISQNVFVSAEAGEEKTPISFSWDPADTSADPNHLIIISGTFERQGPIPDSTTDLKGELAGTLKSKIKNESTTMTETIDGTKTITTTAEAHSQKAGKFQGTITIDGEEFSVKFKPSGDVTILQDIQVSTGPTIDLTINLEKLTISGTVKMCNDNKECLEGFGIIQRLSSQSSEPLGSVTFVTDLLEAEVIGDDGLFELELTRTERIEVIH